MIDKVHHKQVILPSFRDIFITRLLEHHIVPTHDEAKLFCDHLYTTGAYVAGSFILDCLLGTNYHHDIDIYDQTDMVITNYFGNYGDNNLNNLKFTQFLYETGFLSIKTSAGVDPILRSFMNPSNPNYIDKHWHIKDDVTNVIQIIPIGSKLNTRSTIPRFIRATFDLEICQNIFDGHKVYIKNVNKLIYKYDFIKINAMFLSAFYETDPSTLHAQDVTTERMNKYMNRGFNIQVHPKHDEMYQLLTKICNQTGDNKNKYILENIDNGVFDLSIYD
jgi:hypothetical protein